MILRVHVDGAASCAVGDEIWQVSLADAIRTEAEMIAGDVAAGLLHRQTTRAARFRIVGEMTSAPVHVGDRYRAPDDVDYSLTAEPETNPLDGEAKVSTVNPRPSEPIVNEVLRFEDLPLGSTGTRRAIVRWSDGAEDAAMTWFADEILVYEGDHGNSRLMSSRAGVHSVAGSIRTSRDP